MFIIDNRKGGLYPRLLLLSMTLKWVRFWRINGDWSPLFVSPRKYIYLALYFVRCFFMPHFNLFHMNASWFFLIISLLPLLGMIGLIWGFISFLKFLKRSKFSTGKEGVYFILGLFVFIVSFKLVAILPMLFESLMGM